MEEMKTYLFIFDNDTNYKVDKTYFKDAMLDAFHYNEGNNDLFEKSINGFEESDIKGMVDLYNHFAYISIENIYIVEEKVY